MRLIIVILMFLTVNANADQSQKFYIFDSDAMYANGSSAPITGYTVAASGAESWDLDMDTIKPVGYVSLQVEVSGSGTLKITHESSNDGLDYNTASGFSDIVTALTAGSAFYDFDMPFCKHLKLVFTETGGANSITIDRATLAIQ